MTEKPKIPRGRSGGRPKLDVKKDAVLHVRVTPNQLASYKARADASGKSLASWVVERLN